MKFSIVVQILFIYFALISISSTLNIPNDEELELDEDDIYVGVENAVTITSTLVPFNSSFDIFSEKPQARFQFRQRSNSYCAPEQHEDVENSTVSEELVCTEQTKCTLETLSPRDLFQHAMNELMSDAKSLDDMYKEVAYIQGVLQTTLSSVRQQEYGRIPERRVGYGPITEQQQQQRRPTNYFDSDEHNNDDYEQNLRNNYHNALHAEATRAQMNRYPTVETRQGVHPYFPSEIQTHSTQNQPQTYSIRRSYTSPDGTYHNAYNYYQSYSQTYGTST